MSTATDTSYLIDAFVGVQVVILTSLTADGAPRSRPMALQEIDPQGGLWFFIGRSSHLAHEIHTNPKVAIAADDERTTNYVAVSGKAHAINDPERIRRLWHEDYLTWFPLGVADPDLLLIRVDVDAGECWKKGTYLHFVVRGPRAVLG